VGFFSKDSDESAGGDPKDWIAADAIPPLAEARLAELNASDLFTSTLSANEFALLSDLGPRPLAQVLGASVYKIGWEYLPAEAQWGGSDLFWQLETITKAWSNARRGAFERLRDEARMIGADAVVGVHLRRGRHDWAKHTVDFVVSGTGIRHPGSEPDVAATPMLSDLSVQDYWRLTSGGWSPAGLLASTSVVFVSQGFRTRMRRRVSIARNQELLEFSDGFSGARHSVMTDLRAQAKAANADGVVGVSFEYEIGHGKFAVRGVGRQGSQVSQTTVAMGGAMPMGGADKRSGVVITVHAVGTAIRRNHGAAKPPSATALMNLGATR
jgi:uncharacterized protein YbjQ (UPF0145 family)